MHKDIYNSIYICVCVCVCVFKRIRNWKNFEIILKEYKKIWDGGQLMNALKMAQEEAKQMWTRVSTVDNFFVKFRRRSESIWTESSVASDSRTFILRDLLCGTEYEFMLLVSSRVGNSSASNTVTAKTKGSPPEYLPRT